MNQHDHDHAPLPTAELETISVDDLATATGGGVLDPVFQMLSPVLGPLQPVTQPLFNIFHTFLPFL